MKRDLYYLSYGSNTSVRQMLERCPDAIYVGTAELKGWRLLFKGSQSGSYLTIEKKKGRKVPVLVWKVSELDIEPATEKNMATLESDLKRGIESGLR